jgi:hypothetical protein
VVRVVGMVALAAATQEMAEVEVAVWEAAAAV